MPFTPDPDRFRFPAPLAAGVKGKRVLISGAGKDRGLGQALALAAGLSGAAHVGVHFHASYDDGLDLVAFLQKEGVAAFPVQADVTNLGDLWATRSYVIDRMGGKPPDLLICNSGLSEKGYLLGRTLREVEGESRAMRRARVRQAFMSSLGESTRVLDTKVDGFLAMTHLWAGEAVHAGTPLRVVYISSRQAVDPGPGVPGYVLANWAVLALPRLLEVNLGKSAPLISPFSVLLPFVRTGMTDEYAANPKVFGRWQPRMLEPFEAARCLFQALARSDEETRGRMLELAVDPGEGGIRTTWREARLTFSDSAIPWSEAEPLLHPGS